MNGSLRLRDYPGDLVRLSCEKCGRSCDKILPIEEGDERANLSDNVCTDVDASHVAILRHRSTGTGSDRIGGATTGAATTGAAPAPANFRWPRLQWSTRLERWSLASRTSQWSGRLVVGCGRHLVFLSRADRRSARLRVQR